VEDLTQDEARAIYRAQYIERPGFLAIGNEALFDAVVDCGVNMGQKRAAMLLQRALGVREDGFFGPATRAALQALQPGQVYRRFVASWVRRYGRIITNDPKQAEFAAGWMNRVAGFIEREP
jgi:lysozyme family protein